MGDTWLYLGSEVKERLKPEAGCEWGCSLSPPPLLTPSGTRDLMTLTLLSDVQQAHAEDIDSVPASDSRYVTFVRSNPEAA